MTAFKGWQNTSRNPLFAKFQNIKFFQSNNAFGFDRVKLAFNADLNTSTKVNNANLQYWYSYIGNIFLFQNTSAEQPIFIASTSAFNNKPSVLYTGNRWNVFSRPIFPSSDRTIVLVAKMNSISGSQNIVLADSTLPNKRVALGGAGSITGIGVFNGTTPVLQTTSENTNPHIIIITPGFIMVDGAVLASGNSTIQEMTVNHISFTGSVNANCNLSDYIEFDYAMSQAQALSFTDVLKGVYNIP